MQMAAPEAIDIEREPEHTTSCTASTTNAAPLRPAMPDRPAPGRARRAVRADLLRRHGERAELGRPHDIEKQPRGFAGETDQPIAALLADLKQRGLLDETLVIWGGEFGRLPIVPERAPSTGRDHNPHAFTAWLAGGGVKGASPRRNRRDRPQGRRRPRQRQRPARHDPAPARPGPHEAHLPLQRPRLPPDRRRVNLAKMEGRGRPCRWLKVGQESQRHSSMDEREVCDDRSRLPAFPPSNALRPIDRCGPPARSTAHGVPGSQSSL
jgi:hypothetical protein